MKSNRLYVMLFIGFVYVLIFIVYWFLELTHSTLIVMWLFWTLILGIIIYIVKRSEQLKDEDATKKQKVELISPDVAETLLDEHISKFSIVPNFVGALLPHNIPAETPDKSPSYFYYKTLRDKYDLNYFFVFLNRKNLDTGIIKSTEALSNIKIDYVLRNASESIRDYIPSVTEQYDMSGRLISTQTAYKKPVLPVKEEARIGE